MTRVLFTSDLHLFHKLPIRLRGFADADEQLASLRETWNEHVTKRDTVWILGDLNVGRQAEAIAFIDTLPGTKHLVFGNHDKGHPAYCSPAAQARYFPTFASAQTQAQVKLAGRKVLLSHLPYDDTNDARHGLQGRFAQWRFPDLGEPLVHGHTHSKRTFTRSVLGSPQVHIGIDAFPSFATQEDILSLLDQP